MDPTKHSFKKGFIIAVSQKALTATITVVSVVLPKYDGWLAIAGIVLLWGLSFLITYIDEKAIADTIGKAILIDPKDINHG